MESETFLNLEFPTFPKVETGNGVENDPEMKIFKMVSNGPQTCLMTIQTCFGCCIALELPKIEIKVGDKYQLFIFGLSIFVVLSPNFSALAFKFSTDPLD